MMIREKNMATTVGDDGNVVLWRISNQSLRIGVRRHCDIDIVELTSSSRSEKYEQLNSSKVYDSELCMLALPPVEQEVLMRVSQYLFCHGLIPVVVRSPTEALIHSRYSRFAIIILPDDDPAVITKVRSFDGMNRGTPVIVISCAETIPESTLQMMNSQQIHGIVQRMQNTEKFGADLIAALCQFFGPTFHRGKLPCGPFSFHNFWNTNTYHTSAPAALALSHHLETSGPPRAPCGVTPGTPITKALQPGHSDIINASQQHEDTANVGKVGGEQQQGDSALCTAISCQSVSVSRMIAQTAAQPSVYPSLESSVQEGQDLLPGIETLLTAIQVVEGEVPEKIQTPTHTHSQQVLNFSASSEEGVSVRQTTRKTQTASSDSHIKSTGMIVCETELESLHDGKGPMSVLAAKRPYFLALDSCREPLADDERASPVDRHNAKERHRRVRITKAAEFFKAVIPCMDPNMDKATAFHMTVYYMLFLRNALREHDPTILPALHKTYKEEWSEVFNMEETVSDGK